MLKIEWLKIKSYKAFYVFWGLHTIFFLIVYFGFTQIGGLSSMLSPYFHTFPSAWYYASYVSGYFSILLCFLYINFITNEISSRTLRQHIIDGISRKQMFLSKVKLAIVFSLYVTLLAFFSALIAGSTNTSTDSNTIKHFIFIPMVFLQVLGYHLFAANLALYLKKAAPSILIFLIYKYIAEPIIGNFIIKEVNAYMPMNAFDNLIADPISLDSIGFSINHPDATTILVALAYLGVLIYGIYYYFKSQDL
jgi:ABC-type transport system involved in multi-copper enzyme maturation permease subunit